MKTGIVLEIKDNKAMLMITGGDFVSAPARPEWQVGDVVAYKVRKTLPNPKIWIAVAALFFTVLIGTQGYSIYFTQTTLISLDVNPSIEIGVNRLDQVISVKGFNQDGEQTINRLNMKNTNYEKAIQLLVQSDYLQDFIDENSAFVFAVKSSNRAKEKEVLSFLQSNATALFSFHKDEKQLKYFIVDEEIIQQAHQHHLTPGKYMLLLSLKEVAPEINILDYKNSSIGEIHTCIEQHNEPEHQKAKHSKGKAEGQLVEEEWHEDNSNKDTGEHNSNQEHGRDGKKHGNEKAH